MAFKNIQGEVTDDSRGSVFDNGLQSAAIGSLNQGATGPQGVQGEQGEQGVSIVDVDRVDDEIVVTLSNGDMPRFDVPTVEAINGIQQVPDNPAQGEDSIVTLSFMSTPDFPFRVPAGAQGIQGQFVEQLFAREDGDGNIPDVPMSAQFDLPSGTITGTGAWSDVVPAGTTQLWEIRANVDPVTAINDVVAIPAASWGTAFQAGSEGPPGMDGDPGIHGSDISDLEVRAATPSVDADGNRLYDVFYTLTTYSSPTDTTGMATQQQATGMIMADKGDKGDTGDTGNYLVPNTVDSTDPTDVMVTFDVLDFEGTDTGTDVGPISFGDLQGDQGIQGPQGVNVGTLSIGEATDQTNTNGGIRYDFTLSKVDPLNIDNMPTTGQFIAPEGPAGPPGTTSVLMYDSGQTYDTGDLVFDGSSIYMSRVDGNTSALTNDTNWIHITAMVDTTYTFTDGTDGSFQVLASTPGATAQTVNVGTLGVGAQDEGSAVTGNFTTLNFLGSGVTASDGGSGVLNINITGGGGGTTFSPSVAVGAGWPGANNPVGVGTDPVVSFTVSNFTGFTLTGLTVSGDVASSNVDADFEGGSFVFDYDASVPGTYTVHFDVTATDNTHGETFTHRVTHSSRVYAPVYAQTLAAQPTAVSDFTGQGAEFSNEFSFEFAGAGMAYMLVPAEVSTPTFRSGFLFLNATNLGALGANWTLYRIDDYIAPGSLTVTLTDGG